MNLEIYMLLLFLCLMWLGALRCMASDRKTWNQGTCAKNGMPWSLFDYSSQGCRGYVAGDQYCWISWPVEREKGNG